MKQDLLLRPADGMFGGLGGKKEEKKDEEDDKNEEV